MSGYKKDYTMSDDKVYTKFGKIVSMLDDLQTTGCFEPGYTQPVYRLVFTGPNGAGKDSLINCLFGYTFLPANCKSKRQMEIRFMHSLEDVSPMIEIDELNKKFTHFPDCSKKIAELQNGTNDSNQGMSIRMTLTSNSSADIYVISTCEQDTGNTSANSLLREALAPSSNFIILVMEAIYLNDDFNQKREHWFNLIRNYDPELERTMVVFTKCDTLPSNFNFNKIKQFLRESNDIFSPKYGFVCVKTNYMPHMEPADHQVRMEREYFCNHKTFGYLSINDYFTLDTVGEKITKWIYETNDFKKTMVYAYSKMQDRMKFVDSELEKFGKDFLDFSTQRKDLYLQGMMNVFCQTVEKVFSGNCDVEEYNLSNVKINKLYVDFLGNYTDYKPSISFKNEKIVEAIQKTEGCGLSGFPSGDVIYSLLEDKLDELRDEISTYSEDIYNTVNQLFKTIINKFFARFPKALTPIEELIISFLDQEFNKTKGLFNDLAEMNFTYLYVDELSKEYKTLIQDSLLKKSFQNQGMNGPNGPNNQNNNNFTFKENKDISFFKSNKDKDSYYQGLANYVKSLVDFIYSEMIRSLREYIPKATGNFFIKSLKSNMNFYLLQYLSKNPEICQDLEEDQDVAQKRVYYIDAQKKLKKINKAISLDDQIAKYFKEDANKTIENILVSQGINSQAIKEKEEQEKEKEKNAKKPKTNINEIGLPPKKDNLSEKNINNPKPNISQAAKNNLFGNATKPQSSKGSNLFGNTSQIKNDNANQGKKNPPTNNLFGNTSMNASTKKPQVKNNLFGNPQPNNMQKSTNLFGNTPTNKNQNNQQNQKKDLNINLKIDPKDGNITGVNVQGNIDPKDAYNFYQKNKQYMPSGQQMLSGAQKVGNFLSQLNNSGNSNNNSGDNKQTKKANSSTLANLFGSKK